MNKQVSNTEYYNESKEKVKCNSQIQHYYYYTIKKLDPLNGKFKERFFNLSTEMLNNSYCI